MTRPSTAGPALVAALLLAACTSGSGDSSTSTTSAPEAAASSSTTSAAVAVVLRPDGLGALTFGMDRAAAQATRMIGPEGPGCELAGTTGADLLPPLEGSVTFSPEGSLSQVELRSGATTVEGVAPDATIDQVLETYDGRNGFTVERDDSTTDVFGIFVLRVSRSGAGYGFVFGEGASKADSVSAPGPAFCD